MITRGRDTPDEVRVGRLHRVHRLAIRVGHRYRHQRRDATVKARFDLSLRADAVDGMTGADQDDDNRIRPAVPAQGLQ